MLKLKNFNFKTNILKIVLKYFAIALGSAIFAVGFQFFMFPNHIISGGVVGIAMILNNIFGFPVGGLTLIMNIPLFIIAWKGFGREFMIGSLVGTVLTSIFVDIFATFNIALTYDPMLAAIIGGVIKGAGLGIVYYVGATTGGVDIVAKLLRRKNPNINFGTFILIIDTLIITAYAFILDGYESAMYSIIGMFVVSRVIDLALYGIDNSCVCYIISDKCTQIVDQIVAGHLHRGVTLLNGEGAYSHANKQVILCVIKRTQIPELRRMIKNIDECAFFILSDAKNVFGKGFENISEVR